MAELQMPKGTLARERWQEVLDRLAEQESRLAEYEKRLAALERGAKKKQQKSAAEKQE